MGDIERTKPMVFGGTFVTKAIALCKSYEEVRRLISPDITRAQYDAILAGVGRIVGDSEAGLEYEEV